MNTTLRLLMPGSIVLATVMMACLFRYDMAASGTDNVVWLRDRWTGDLKFCGGGNNKSRCFTTLRFGHPAN